MLSNPTTQGIKTVGTDRSVGRTVGRPVLDSEGEHVLVGPPSFDSETWQRIQSELAQRSQNPRQRRHSVNPMLGVAKCAECGKNMRQQSKTTPAGVTHRYYICAESPPCPKVSFIAADAEELVEEAFLEIHADRRVKARVWRDGADHTHELAQTIVTIEALREDRAIGLFSSPEDEQTYRQQMKALTAKRDELSALPVVKAGWVEVETSETYSQVWPTATPEERRTLLTDAGVHLVIYRPNRWEIRVDYSRVIGVGPSGRELYDATRF